MSIEFHKGAPMLPTREMLVRKLKGDHAATIFLGSEEDAVVCTEYTQTIPSFLQTPGIARAFMEVHDKPTTSQVQLGIEARRVRAADAWKRKNIFFFTQDALRVEAAQDALSGKIRFLLVSDDLRFQQLTELALAAEQPHISLHVIPDGAALSDTRSSHSLEFADESKTYFTETEKGGLTYVADRDEQRTIQINLCHVAQVALGENETIDMIRTFRNLL